MPRSRLSPPAVILPLAVISLAVVTILAARVPVATGRAVPDGPMAPTATPRSSSCVASLTKAVDPAKVAVGSPVQVSMSVSMTCGAKRLPIDMVLVVDESHSMAKKTGNIGPGQPTPTRGTPGTSVPQPTREGDEPGWCRTDSGTVGSSTPTPKWWQDTPTPGVPRPTEDPEEAGAEDLVRLEKDWGKTFLDDPVIKRDLATDRLRLGFVSFNSETRVRQSITNQASKITSAFNKLRAAGTSRVLDGLRQADQQFTGTGSRVSLDPGGRLQVLVLLSDFNFCRSDIRSAGRYAKNAIRIGIGFGRDYQERNLLDFASSRDLAIESKDVKELIRLYEEVLAPPQPITLRELTAHDRLADDMGLIPDSVAPPTVTIESQLLTWPLDARAWPVMLGYRVAPQAAGLRPISVEAGIDWVDSEGLLGSAPFPEAVVEVEAFTPTPTPTDTPTPTPTDTVTPSPTATRTPTPTPTPGSRYIPYAARLYPEPLPTATLCIPERQTIDTALIVDTSTSMSEAINAGGVAKLSAAIDAAIEIVQLLKPADQATVIWFNRSAGVAAQLTSDKARLTAALRGLSSTQETGTAIDLGLQAAFDEMQSARHLLANNRSMILVTDGAQTVGQEQLVRDVAVRIRAAGIKLVTVGLGPEIDEALLQEIAWSPTLYFRSPTAEGLTEIYRQVALLIPCP